VIATAGHAIVTGGTSGIGQALCVELASRGYQVTVVGRSATGLETTQRMLAEQAGPATDSNWLCIQADVTDPAAVNAMVAQSFEHFGAIDVMISSAGIGRSAESERVLPHATADLPLAEWTAVLDVNLRGVFLCCAAVLPYMQRQRRGHIVNIGSSTTPEGLRGTAYGPAYCASKFAVVGLTESIAAENERAGIRAQVIFPGPVETPLVHQTVLARPFGGAITAGHFAAAVVDLIRQPADGVVIHPHLLPFRGARGTRKPSSMAETQ
jgi:NAD(P)-dependent dehydrogenase (short-subunit alcohol dehydrogenase family)